MIFILNLPGLLKQSKRVPLNILMFILSVYIFVCMASSNLQQKKNISHWCFLELLLSNVMIFNVSIGFKIYDKMVYDFLTSNEFQMLVLYSIEVLLLAVKQSSPFAINSNLVFFICPFLILALAFHQYTAFILENDEDQFVKSSH